PHGLHALRRWRGNSIRPGARLSRTGAGFVIALAVAACLVGCGGGGGRTEPAVRPPLNPNPIVKAGAGIDPDQFAEGGSDVVSTVRPLGQGRYRIVVQNSSSIGFINSFVWLAPEGVTVTAVTGSSTGHCKLAGRN